MVTSAPRWLQLTSGEGQLVSSDKRRRLQLTSLYPGPSLLSINCLHPSCVHTHVFNLWFRNIERLRMSEEFGKHPKIMPTVLTAANCV